MESKFDTVTKLAFTGVTPHRHTPKPHQSYPVPSCPLYFALAHPTGAKKSTELFRSNESSFPKRKRSEETWAPFAEKMVLKAYLRILLWFGLRSLFIDSQRHVTSLASELCHRSTLSLDFDFCLSYCIMEKPKLSLS
ncbi:hypothetical protein AVEN_61544-1 [Araneus ventricosus]|uniref:Uncharacterized protein n=1 Tax=Araneus ventricosus TaxID=182803 RepID=A0A4Y2MFU6_ARAVE|nr:hypothetical protein AVEN_61544-1 [Araneus ventricosus]